MAFDSSDTVLPPQIEVGPGGSVNCHEATTRKGRASHAGAA